MTEQKVPSLRSLAFAGAVEQMRSPASKLMLEEAAEKDNKLDVGVMEVVNEQEVAHLAYCTGRVPLPVTCNDYHPYQPQYHIKLPDLSYRRPPGELDARLTKWDAREEEFVVRLDAWVNPEFWAECRIPLPQLQEWLREQGVEMQYRVIGDSDGDM
jgi:hypothetical protein